MKKLILLVSLVVLNSCSQSVGSSDAAASAACSSSIAIGSWRNASNGDVLTFASDCSYRSSNCSSNGTYPNVTASSGYVIVNITSTIGGGSCLPLGQTQCAYAINNGLMAYDCGGGVVTYTKQ